MNDKELQKKDLEQKIIETLKTIYDPEIPVNIYEIGLIYKITVRDDLSVEIVSGLRRLLRTLFIRGSPERRLFTNSSKLIGENKRHSGQRIVDGMNQTEGPPIGGPSAEVM